MKQINDALPKGTVLQGKEYQYNIDRVLGHGSFGITYLATVDTRNELGDVRTFVCVKEFFMREVNEREGSSVTSGSKNGLFMKYRHKFVNEAKRLSELHHPNIVRVIESFEANNTVYYSMQLIEGGTLDDIIKQRGWLGERETLQIADKIAKALDYMHSWNMLHLDMKPSNVMMQRGNPVLIDFGLSKQYDEEGNPESSTTIGGGTPGYSPIEQTNYIDEPHKELPVTMDIYALGATMYKMLTGERPPIASDIVNDGFPVEELKKKGVSEETIQLLSKMMHFQKKARPQNLSSVRSEISNIISNLPNEKPAVEENTTIREDTKLEPAPKSVSFKATENGNTSNPPIKEKSSQPQAVKTIPLGNDVRLNEEIGKPKSNEKISPFLRMVLIALGCVLVVIGIIFLLRGFNGSSGGVDSNTMVDSSLQVEEASMSQHMANGETFTGKDGKTFTYTGPLNEDGMPEGKGVGIYKDGNYKGEYQNGIREGEGEYIFRGGEGVYVGTYKADAMAKGRFTYDDNTYFEGTFKDGNVYNGYFHKANGALDGEMRNGLLFE